MKSDPSADRKKARPAPPAPSTAPEPEKTEEGSSSLGVVIVAHGSLAPVLQENAEGIVGELAGKTKTEQAKVVGAEMARLAQAAGIEEVVFDRRGSKYHGRVKAFADAAREAGLKF